MDYFPLPRLNARPYRNILHDFDSYNYTIVLRVFKLTDLEQFKEDGSRPKNWDTFDDTTVTLAATGGSYSFPNCWGDPAQHSDTFIQNLTITIPLGARGIFGGTTGSSINFTIKEPNGINFLQTLLSAFNTLNEFRKDQVLSATDQVPVLLSIYFNAPPNSQSESAVGDVYSQLSGTVRHIPIQMIKVDFDISTSGTNYNIEATTFATSAQLASTQRAIYEKITEVKGVKVGDFLYDLINKMNEVQSSLTKDDSNEHSKEILTFAIQPVGTRAQNFFNSTLSATLKDGASLADSPMKSPDDLNDLFGEEETDSTTTQPASPSDGAVAVPPSTSPPAYTSELGKKRQQILLAAMDKFGISDPNERANFWANCTHETGDFKLLGENLNYSAKGLVATFPKYFNAGTAATYANKPEAIASRIYANRLGNGDEQSKDGWIYRGRGYLQITGKTNYKACGDYLNLDLVRQPQLLEDEVNAANSACWFWVKKVRPAVKSRINNPSYQKLVKSKNFPITPQDATNVYVTRHIVNGGTIGLDDVVARYNRYKNDPTITKSNSTGSSTSTATPSTPVAGRTGEKLSTNFYLEDFTRSTAAINKGIDNTPTPEHKAALKALCENVLEKIYAAYQRPLKINSGYRSPAVNNLVGGSSSSQHSRGEAADIEISGIPTYDLAQWVTNNIVYDQVILEFYNPKEGPNSGWVHVSYTAKGKNRKQPLTAVKEGGKTVYKPGLIGTGVGTTGSPSQPNPTLPADGNPSNTAQDDKDAIEAAKKRRKEQKAFLKAANDSSLSNSERSLKLAKEMTVTSVVELLALNSTYCLAALRDAETSGMPAFIPYIKVYTTYEFKGYDPRFNVLIKHVTFNVVGIEWAAPAQGGVVDSEEVANQIKDNTIRGYNYLFTGKNADILGLDLTFNTTFYTALARFNEGTNATASSTQSTVDADQPTNTSGANDPGTRPSSASGSMASSQPVLPDRDNSSKGMPRDFNETEMKFKSLLPNVFAKNPDLLKLEMEIVGDPELIPKTEMALTAAEFKYLYLQWEGSRNKPLIERPADPTGFSTCFFLFTLGNPDPTMRSNAMLAGYYQFMSITANFKESGGFTMNVTGAKDIRLTVSTPEAKSTGAALDQEAAKAQESRDVASGGGVVVDAPTSPNSIGNPTDLSNGSLLSGSFPSLTDSIYNNFMQDLATGLSSATGSFASNFLNNFNPKVNVSSTDAVVSILAEGSVAGMPTSSAQASQAIPKRVSSLYKDAIQIFENSDPNPMMDVTKPVQNALFAEFDARDRYEQNIENFLGSLTLEPDLNNQSQNILQSAIDSFTGAAITGLSNAASDIATAFLNKSPSLKTGSNISLSSTGNLRPLANSVGTLVGQAISTTLPTVESASSKLTSIIPDFKVPGTPGMLTENSAALQPSLEQLTAEVFSKTAPLPTTDQFSSVSNNLVDATVNQLQQQMNTALTSDQLKLDAQVTNSRFKSIASGVPVQNSSLQAAAGKIATAVVNSVGGQSSMPGSSSSLSSVTRAAGSVASSVVAAAAEQLLNAPSANPLSSQSDMPSMTSSFTQEQIVTLEGISANTLAAIAAAKPPVVKTVPAEVSSITSLSAEQIVTAGKNVLYASMVGTDINSLSAYAKGLSATSLTGLTVRRSV